MMWVKVKRPLHEIQGTEEIPNDIQGVELLCQALVKV